MILRVWILAIKAFVAALDLRTTVVSGHNELLTGDVNYALAVNHEWREWLSSLIAREITRLDLDNATQLENATLIQALLEDMHS